MRLMLQSVFRLKRAKNLSLARESFFLRAAFFSFSLTPTMNAVLDFTRAHPLLREFP